MTTINYFQNIKTIQELKKVYFSLAKKFHPDINKNQDTTAIMQDINNQYDNLFNKLKDCIDYSKFKESENSDFSSCNYTYKQETSDIFRDIISKIIHLEDIEMEICGYWLWLSGDTKQYKDYLKTNGFMWSGKKFQWYWRPVEHRSYNRKIFSMDQIREKYGSQKIQNQSNLKLQEV